MGRAGIEPAALGLKVRPDKRQRTARLGNPCSQVVPELQLTTCHAAYGDKLVRASVLAPTVPSPLSAALLEAYVTANGYVCPGPRPAPL